MIAEADKLQNLFSLVVAGHRRRHLLLSIGVSRVHVGPRWVGPTLWAFLVLEFVGSAVAPVLGLAAATLAVIPFVALAATVWTSPRSTWASGVDNPAAAPAPAMA